MRLALRLVIVTAAAAFLAHCRANNPVADAELTATEERTWFDVYGDPADCGIPASGCPAGSYDASFVDACVSQGFQAKSCGCVAACSQRFVYKQKPAGDAVANGQGDAAPTCPGPDRMFVRQAWENRTSDVAKCYVGLVCQGDSRHCREDLRPDALRLRALAKGACAGEVVGRLCPDGMKDTLACGDGDVDQLSSLYADAFRPGAAALRRCVRERLCNEAGGGCGADDKARVERVAKVVTGSCSYWLASLCSLDGK